MDAIFKALADPTRRALLDSLRDKSGQTLTELEAGLGMTRFGVMKHLKVLEDATLVVTRKSGRFKYHYLNALPIQEVADRWMAPYAKPLARFALDLKNNLEGMQTMADKPDYVLETYIRTTPKALWDALINPEKTPLYFYGSKVESTLRPGSPFRYSGPDGKTMLDGEVLEVVPEKKLATTFVPTWQPGAATTRVVYELEPMGEVVKLTLTHYEIEKAGGAIEGWQLIFAGLKTYLETGKPLNVPNQM
ncbi:MAG: metalloregulator ArsR/SmtB family transcription factor [Devosia sp.]|nr:metalloregulator ArsR/SmtB family transcription factor [Devosia sp.]